MKYRCDICDEPLSFSTGVVQYDMREPTTAVFAHSRCAPGGYHVDFNRLAADGLDGPNGWRIHLEKKVWMNLGGLWCLEAGHAMALELRDAFVRPQAPPMRSVAASIPRRPPRTPDNPRHITTGTRTRVLERDEFRCRRCGHGPDMAPLVVDHIVPVAKGGTADIENLQTLCRPCNAGKSDREPTPHDLIRGRT